MSNRGEHHGGLPDQHRSHSQQQHGGYQDHQPHTDHQHEEWRRWRHQQQPWQRHDVGRHRSGALEWTAAVVFTVLAIVVLVAAVVVLIVVRLVRTRAPYIAVLSASLDALVYDQQGALDDVQLSLLVEARNGNARSGATFSDLEARLAFGGTVLAKLRADAFRVPPKGALPLAYVAPFGVDGEAKTQWKVAGLVGVKHWTRLACELRFFRPNGTALSFRCSSKSKFWFF